MISNIYPYPQLFTNKITVDIIHNIWMFVFSHDQNFIDNELLQDQSDNFKQYNFMQNDWQLTYDCQDGTWGFNWRLSQTYEVI